MYVALPELARYFIVSSGFEPKRLYENCLPSTIEGVFRQNATRARESTTSPGWHRAVVNGNFVLFKIDFWFENEVQDFLVLVLSTQDQIIHRWNEQSVIGMIRLLFTEKDDERKFDLGE